MSNETIWLSFLVFDFTVLLLGIALFGRAALYVIITANLILCNIQVLKLIDLFGFVVSFGSIAYASIFLATDLLGEVYGIREARKAVWMGLFAMIFTTVSLQVTVFLNPSLFDSAHPHMSSLFQLSPRIAFASLTAYAISQYHDVWSFHWWHQKTKGKHLWLRNNASTLCSQLLDTILFILLAFYGVYEAEILWSIFWSTLLIKWLVAILDTPIIYIGRSLFYRYLDKHEPPITVTPTHAN